MSVLFTRSSYGKASRPLAQAVLRTNALLADTNVRALLKDPIEIIVMSPEMYNAHVLVDSRQEPEDDALFKEGDEYLLGWYPRNSAIWNRKIFINEGVSII